LATAKLLSKDEEQQFELNKMIAGKYLDHQFRLQEQEKGGEVAAKVKAAPATESVEELRKAQIESEKERTGLIGAQAALARINARYKNQMLPFDKAYKQAQLILTEIKAELGAKEFDTWDETHQIARYLSGQKITTETLKQAETMARTALLEKQAEGEDVSSPREIRSEFLTAEDVATRERMIRSSPTDEKLIPEMNLVNQYSTKPYVWIWENVPMGRDRFRMVDLPVIKGRQLYANEVAAMARRRGMTVKEWLQAAGVKGIR